MNQTQRDAFELVKSGLSRVDAVFAAIAPEIARIVRSAPTPFTQLARRRVMAQIDTVLNRAFGLTKRAALTSDLFATILRATDAAAERPYLRLLERIRETVLDRSPEMWGRMRMRLLSGGRGPEDAFARVVTAFEGPVVDKQRILRAGILDPQRRWVDGSGYRLSDRVWLQGRQVRRNIDNRLRLAIRNGEDPIRVARELEQYLNPEYQPLRYGRNGTIIVDTRKQVVTLKPRGGHGSNAARRLARTEIMRVHGQATIRSATQVPGVIGVRWSLSNGHPEIDPCDDKAAGSSRGMPTGVYLPNEVPAYPTHSNEMCTLAHEHMSRNDLIDLLVSQYGGETV